MGCFYKVFFYGFALFFDVFGG